MYARRQISPLRRAASTYLTGFSKRNECPTRQVSSIPSLPASGFLSYDSSVPSTPAQGISPQAPTLTTSHHPAPASRAETTPLDPTPSNTGNTIELLSIECDSVPTCKTLKDSIAQASRQLHSTGDADHRHPGKQQFRGTCDV